MLFPFSVEPSLLAKPTKLSFPTISLISTIEFSPTLTSLSPIWLNSILLNLALDPEKSMASFLMFAKLEFKISPMPKSISIASDEISS